MTVSFFMTEKKYYSGVYVAQTKNIKEYNDKRTKKKIIIVYVSQ